VNVQKGHIKIGLSPMMNVQMFTNALNQFHRLYPKDNFSNKAKNSKLLS
jgi:DNA-binding transcriptional LysR family regulator